ncbi:hypothetical protein [Nonomuraea bangladeshensis]
MLTADARRSPHRRPRRAPCLRRSAAGWPVRTLDRLIDVVATGLTRPEQ